MKYEKSERFEGIQSSTLRKVALEVQQRGTSFVEDIYHSQVQFTKRDSELRISHHNVKLDCKDIAYKVIQRVSGDRTLKLEAQIELVFKSTCGVVMISSEFLFQLSATCLRTI